MTDAAVRVTQSAVEQFSKRFLQSVGCTFEENDEHIVISVPEGTDIGLSHGDHRLARGESQNTGEQIKSVHPESEFFQQLLQDASERYPIGAMSMRGLRVVYLSYRKQDSRHIIIAQLLCSCLRLVSKQ
jgi:hypothetical protein